MPLFRRRHSAPAVPPGWASGAGSPIGAVPPSVVAVVVENRLPPAVAACVEGGPDGAGPDWLDVGDVVDELVRTGAALPGALYAMGAYGQLDGCFTMVDETAERAARADQLLDLAVSHGVSAHELSGLFSWASSLAESGADQAEEVAARADQDPATLHGRDLADRAFDLTDSADPDDVRAGAALYARLAEESAGDANAVLDARLRQHLALYEVGERDVALPQLSELADGSSTASDTDSLLDSARAVVVVDAATHDGPDAARDAWLRARRQSDRFPSAGHQVWLVSRLRGGRAPQVMGELVRLLRGHEQPNRGVREALATAEQEAPGA